MRSAPISIDNRVQSITSTGEAGNDRYQPTFNDISEVVEYHSPEDLGMFAMLVRGYYYATKLSFSMQQEIGRPGEQLAQPLAPVVPHDYAARAILPFMANLSTYMQRLPHPRIVDATVKLHRALTGYAYPNHEQDQGQRISEYDIMEAVNQLAMSMCERFFNFKGIMAIDIFAKQQIEAERTYEEIRGSMGAGIEVRPGINRIRLPSEKLRYLQTFDTIQNLIELHRSGQELPPMTEQEHYLFSTIYLMRTVEMLREYQARRGINCDAITRRVPELNIKIARDGVLRIPTANSTILELAQFITDRVFRNLVLVNNTGADNLNAALEHYDSVEELTAAETEIIPASMLGKGIKKIIGGGRFTRYWKGIYNDETVEILEKTLASISAAGVFTLDDIQEITKVLIEKPPYWYGINATDLAAAQNLAATIIRWDRQRI